LSAGGSLRGTSAVAGSLMYWQRWVEANPAEDDAVREKLLRQGELWRSLLAGEIRADDLLGLSDYRQAFGDYTRQLRLLARKYPKIWLLVALGITWKTVAVTVGRAAALLERPMLDDGLSEAVKGAR
jgi:hypothetical protein